MKKIIEKVISKKPQTLDDIKAELNKAICESDFEFTEKEWNEIFDDIILALR